MFGRKRRQQEAAYRQVQRFAMDTIDFKHRLVEETARELNEGVWFEDGHHLWGRRAVEEYLTYLVTTENVVFLTVNRLLPDVRQRAESVAPSILETLTYPHGALGLGASPAYYAHNALQRDLFQVDPFDAEENDLHAADATVAYGFMKSCEQSLGLPMEVFAQHVTVACALAAGWAQSPQRATIT